MGTDDPLRFCQTCKPLAHIWNLEPVFFAFRDDGVCHCCKKPATGARVDGDGDWCLATKRTFDMKPTIGRIIHVYMRSENGKIDLGPLCARVVALRAGLVVMLDRPHGGAFTCECIALPLTPGEKQFFSTDVSMVVDGWWKDVYTPVIAWWEWPPRE